MKLEMMKVLSEHEMTEIHEASVSILENTGVVVLSKRALDLLDRNGAIVDYDRKIVRMPRILVETCLKKVPSAFYLFNRDGSQALKIGDRTSKCASGHNAIFIIDANTKIRRPSTLLDVEKFALISDKLIDIDIVGVPAMPQDVPSQASLIYAVKALYENTAKPLFYSTESSAVNASIIKIMKVIADCHAISEYPSAICQLSSTSPLLWEEGAADALLDTSMEGVPLNLLPEPMTGISAPYTTAGLLAMHNTEVLSGIVISQLARSGAPVLYGSSWTTYDMRHANAVIGGPETSILRIAGSQMAMYYDIPSHTTAPNSDANAHDEQNSWERTSSCLCAFCAGNDIVMNCGMFATGLTVSLEQLVLDDEIVGIIRRLNKGMQVSSRTIAADVINQAGPRGSFIMEDHTFEFLRSGEFRETKVSNTKNYDSWLESGAPDVLQNAGMKVVEYLKEGNAKKLDSKMITQMEQIIKVFESDIARS